MALIEFLKDKVKRTTTEILDEVKREATRKMRMEIAGAKRQIIKDMTALYVLLTATIFLAIGVVYFFTEYLMLTKTLGFLIVGAIMLLTGILLKVLK